MTRRDDQWRDAESFLDQALREGLTVGLLLQAMSRMGSVRIEAEQLPAGRWSYSFVRIEGGREVPIPIAERLSVQTRSATDAKRRKRAENVAEVARLTAQGSSITQIATRLNLSARYVSELRKGAEQRD